MIDNAIVQKEFVQASHRKRTYFLRAGLPVIAIVLILPSIVITLRMYGQDWRAISQIVRPVFITGAWLALIAFSLIASSYITASLRDEWTHKTMEVLCVAPLSRRQIVYGKFGASLGRLLMAALSLLPIMGIWLHLGRMPIEIMLGSGAVVLGSILLFASMALLQAAAFRPGKAGRAFSISLAIPFWIALALLDVFVWEGNPLLEAAIAPRALFLVLSGSGPGGMATGTFALLSFGIHLVMSAVALGLSPWAFSRAFGRYIGGGKAKQGRLSRLRRFCLGKRPAMKPKENPFTWQEKGPSTSLLSRAIWIVYGVIAVVMIVHGFTSRFGFRFLQEETFWIPMAVIGLFLLPMIAAFYGTSVFARDKSGGRSQSLLLTGYPAKRFLWSKIRATYWALRVPMLVVAALCVIMFSMLERRFWYEEGSPIAVIMVAQSLILGPAMGVIIGMVFSVVAKSSAQAMRGLVGTVLWMIGLSWGFSIVSFMFMSMPSLGAIGPLLAALGVTAVLMVFTKKWAPWRLGLLLALNSFVLMATLAVCADVMGGYAEEFLMAFGGSAVCWVLMILWFWMGVRLFDSGMACEDASLRRPRVW